MDFTPISAYTGIADLDLAFLSFPSFPQKLSRGLRNVLADVRVTGSSPRSAMRADTAEA
jgi:hypothetical protein